MELAGKKEEAKFICGTKCFLRLLLRCVCEIEDMAVNNKHFMTNTIF